MLPSSKTSALPAGWPPMSTRFGCSGSPKFCPVMWIEDSGTMAAALSAATAPTCGA